MVAVMVSDIGVGVGRHSGEALVAVNTLMMINEEQKKLLRGRGEII